jgi:phosphate starvation-inducible PhoH-like protein
LNDPPEQREISLAQADNDWLANFAGPMEQNLRHVEERLGVDVRRRGHRLQLSGPSGPLARAEAVLRRMFELSASEPMTPERVHLSVQELGFPQSEEAGEGPGPQARLRSIPSAGAARAWESRRYPDQIRAVDLTFGIGPAGTGKTYLQSRALSGAPKRSCGASRPTAVEAARAGALPGDAAQKVDPYLRPMYDRSRCWASTARVRDERQVIEVAPLAFMRTLGNDSHHPDGRRTPPSSR